MAHALIVDDDPDVVDWLQEVARMEGFTVARAHSLRDARIDVSEVAGKPGVYKAVAFLRPHFQLDELTVSLRLVAELPAPAK